MSNKKLKTQIEELIVKLKTEKKLTATDFFKTARETFAKETDGSILATKQ